MLKKRVLALIMVFAIALTIVPFGTLVVSANEYVGLIAENVSCPIEVQVKTDKDSYFSISTAQYTVTVKNVSTKSIERISVKSDFSDLQPISGQLFVESQKLEPNESFSYTYTATIKPSKLNIFSMIFLMIKNIFTGTQKVPEINFDDGRVNTSTTISTKYGSVTVTDKISVWYEMSTEVINTKTEEEFNTETIKLINNQMDSLNFDKNRALTEEYYAQRLIVKGKLLDKIDLSKFSPDTIIYNSDFTEAIVELASQSLTQKCESELRNNSTVTDVYVDIIMQAYADSLTQTSTWGKAYIKANSYEHYLENNNYFDIVTVAVVDTGIDCEHNDLKNRLSSSGYDCIKRTSKVVDENGHGTHVAGIIANCTEGLNVKILPIRVLKADGLGSSYTIAQGIDQAVNMGADVINLSLGGSTSGLIADAVNRAIKKGVSVVCAAGNGDKNGNPMDVKTVSPANIVDAIVVSALDESGNIASFSNYGATVDVAAPGVEVYSTFKDGSYAKMSGTSMAAPHIASVAAMFKLAHPDYTPAQIEQMIKDYCKDLGVAGRDDIYGYGTVDMYDAIPNCTISFNTNGGSSVSNQTVKSTEDIKLPTPTKTYTIKLDANGGSVSQSSYVVSCKLDGWYKSSSLTGVRYAPDALYMTHSNEILYAKWDDAKLGDINYATRTNYNFLGWYSAKEGGSLYDSNKIVNSNITLYAHWEQVKKSIPNYTGWDVNTAVSNLQGLGMIADVRYAYNYNYASGKVYSQNISGSYPVGTTVIIYISNGAKPIAVGDYVNYNGGTTLYRTIAGGPKNGVYKGEASGGTITGTYTYNGTLYYQFKYDGANNPFGWAPYWAFSQLSN